MHWRRHIRGSSLIIAAICAVWATALLVSGGLDTTYLGISISSHDPKRPLLVGALALTVFLVAGGDDRVIAAGKIAAQPALQVLRMVWSWVPDHRVLAGGLALAVTVTSWVYGTKAVGGSDSYGYMSMAELWLKGDLKVRQPFVEVVPWPQKLRSFTPLAYRPMQEVTEVEREDEWTLVPIYAPGLPLLLAGAKLVGGTQAMYVVVPLLAGLLVLATYGIGARLASDAVGLTGAWLVATSPAVLMMMMTTMTDVPVAGVWAASFYLLLGTSARSAFGAGLCASVAVLIRPNLVPLVGILGLRYALIRGDRRVAWSHGMLFALAALPGIVAVAAIHDYLYGSPFRNGYGSLETMFSLKYVGQNLRNYLGWLGETQTPIAWGGLVAALTPALRLWPGQANRPTLVVVALFVLAVWFLYLTYLPWDAWWYLRFLLASWPFIMLGVGALGVLVVRVSRRPLMPVLTLFMLGLGIVQIGVAKSRHSFIIWEGERRYVVGAQMVRRLTHQNSIIISGQHSGSVRFYASRMTMNVDAIERDWLDRAVRWLDEHGVHSYLLLEEWEVPAVKSRFAGQEAMKILDRPPVALYQDPGTLYLYDLLSVQSPNGKPVIVTGTYRSLWAVPKAPDARFDFKRGS